jgi:hypothetical protein
MPLPGSVILTIAVLTVFLMFVTGLKFAVSDRTLYTKLVMTGFFFFIIATLTISFWRYVLDTLPFTIPAAVVGALVGGLVGVRAAERRLAAEGVTDYMEHFAHIHLDELRQLRWWSIVNFYTVMMSLLLINFVGLANVLFDQSKNWAVAASTLGAFLLGTIAPYLIHVWSISTSAKTSSTTSDQ